MFMFEMDEKDDELVMNRNNSKVMWTLCICAFFGALLAGLMIRYLMRKFFPEEDQARPIISRESSTIPRLSTFSLARSSVMSEITPTHKKIERSDTERDSFPRRSTKASFELS